MSDLYEKLLSSGFRFVSYRPRSEKEVRDFLQKKLKTWKVAGQVTVKKVMDRLVEYGHIDDAKFAAWWIEQRGTFRPKGRRVLIQELRQKGVGGEGILESYNELEAAKQAIARKMPDWQQLPLLERKMKLYSFLGRRGFTSSTIHRVIDEQAQKSYNANEEKNVVEG